jgi:DNA (cytosine-5)-methyltransferase 1
VTGIAPTVNAHPGGNTEAKIQIYACIRRLTPLECWRLMGFNDIDFSIAKAKTSDTQLYRQAGNSIVVDVLMPILWNLLGDRND